LYLYLGHNYFDDGLKDELLELKGSEERAAYILMVRINPPIQESVIISNGHHYSAQINSEIGIYGVFVRSVCICIASYIIMNTLKDMIVLLECIWSYQHASNFAF